MKDEATIRTRAAEALRRPAALEAVRAAAARKVAQRHAAMQALRDPQALRRTAAAIRAHTLAHLPGYLERFAAQAAARGAHVHVARSGAEACRIVLRIARAHGCRRVVKAKSMTSEEVGLNAALRSAGLEVVETDLGEFVADAAGEPPAHIVTPIIHRTRHEVAAVLARALGAPVPVDPAAQTARVRAHLRRVFAAADMGITGANFAVAATGSLCLCTNEGNGRMVTTLPRVHVALVGIEKLVPDLPALAVLLKLLARSATGQPLTVYTTLLTGPAAPSDPDGPRALHIVLLDNGRSRILGGPLRDVLRCIRCGACLNACPVYRHVGGHAYGSVYSGPIGSLLTPLLAGLRRGLDLPRASSLCGACAAACPVQIDIPELLVALRRQTIRRQPGRRHLMMWSWALLMRCAWLYRAAQRLLRGVLRDAGDGWARRGPGPLRAWTEWRDLPRPPAESFQRRWARENGDA